MSNQNNQSNSTSDPDSGYRTATPEPSPFVADPDSPHLAPSPRLHPNITTRAEKRRGRRFSDLFTISHRGRDTPTPTFDRENRPKISRPIVDQGEIEVPNHGPYIYNHPSRPRLDVEIPRSSFSDLWGQQYGPIGDTGYNVDGFQHEVRNTQSVDLGRLLGGSRENYRHDTRRYGVSLGGIGDWTALVSGTSTTDLAVSSEHGENTEAEDGMVASYLAPLVSPTLHSSSSSITTSASLPSISDLPPLPLSTSNLPPLPPSPVALNEGPNLSPAPEEDHNPAPIPREGRTRTPTLRGSHVRSSSPLTREPSERWPQQTRHPLRQNPPTRHFVPPLSPPPPPPPSSPIHFPPSSPSPATHWPASLQHFRPSCGVLISNVGSMAMVQPFLVTGENYEDDEGSFVESNAESSIVHVREDTPSPPPALPVSRRLFAGAASVSTTTGPSHTPSAAQSHQRRGSGGLRSLCCGLFPPRRRHHSPTTNPSQPRPQSQHPAPMSQRPAPPTHATIFEEDAEDELDQENQPPLSVENQPSAIFQQQTRTMIENHPPTILETLVDDDDGHDIHEQRTLHQAEEQDAEQEMVDELNVRRSSVRHSWVTVSRWLE
ncbi:hypothetical protein KCU62_g1799, partial [Aureobasidium sp. EXF-3399]